MLKKLFEKKTRNNFHVLMAGLLVVICAFMAILAFESCDSVKNLLDEPGVNLPIIKVMQGTTVIPDSGSYDFGGILIDDPSMKVTFSLENVGNSALILSGAAPYISISGVDASLFVVDVANPPSSTVLAGVTTTFTSALFTASPYKVVTLYLRVELFKFKESVIYWILYFLSKSIRALINSFAFASAW